MKKQKRPSWDPSTTAVQNARTYLPVLAEEFFAAGRKAARKTTKVEELHEFRLAVKHFRYTLELFRPFYGPALDQRLANLRRLQRHLGTITDCTTTRQVLLAAADSRRGPVKQLLRLLDETVNSGQRRFMKYWGANFSAPEVEIRWMRYLKVFAGRARRTAGPPS